MDKNQALQRALKNVLFFLSDFQNPDPDSESGFTFPVETGFGAAKLIFYSSEESAILKNKKE
jgi:hypothetical protein